MKQKAKISILFVLISFLFLRFSFVKSFSLEAAYDALVGSIPQTLPEVSVDSMGHTSTFFSIELPPGKLPPQLSLAYSSSGGNGLLGIGWDLSGFDSIERDPSFGVEYDGKDSFLSSLGGQLLDISGNRTLYHTRRESFIRFVPQGLCGDGPCSWSATTKEGLVYTFGGTSDSRMEALGKNGAIFSWAVSEVRDPFGNGYAVQYIQDSENGKAYPVKILYQDRTISFQYESRPDVFPDYSQGTLVKISKRLSGISITTSEGSSREYSFEYSQGILSNQSVLVSIGRSGSNSNGSENYIDLDLTYSNNQGLFNISVPTSNTDSTYRTLSFTQTYNGFSPQMNYILGLLVQFYSIPISPNPIDYNYNGYMQFVTNIPIIDRNICTNGLVSCLCGYVITGGCLSVAWGNFKQACDEYLSSGGATNCANGVESGLVNWPSLDLDGDGILDFASLGGKDLGDGVSIYGLPIKSGGNSAVIKGSKLPIYYNTFSRTVDLDGDGKTDFAFEKNGKLSAVFSKGISFSAVTDFSNVSLDSANRSMQSFNPYEYLFDPSIPGNVRSYPYDKAGADYFADMDGDGLEDFIHYSSGTFLIYKNTKGAFASPISVGGSAGMYVNSFLDMNRDGKADYVRLVKQSNNEQYNQLSAQLISLNNQMEQETNLYNQNLNLLNSLISGSTVDAGSLQILADYYSGGGFQDDADAILASGAGTPIPASDSDKLTQDLQIAYANISGPLVVQQNTIQTQMNSIEADDAGSTSYAIQISYFDLSSQSITTKSYNIASASIYSSTFADVNSDGSPDFVTFIGNKVTVYLFTGIDGFASGVTSTLNASNGKKLAQYNFGDVNGDGFADLVLHNKEQKKIETYLASGDGKFTLSSPFSFGALNVFDGIDSDGIYRSDLYQIVLNDLNGDGNSDLTLIYLPKEKTSGGIQIRYSPARNVAEDTLVGISNGAGQSTSIQYSLAKNKTGAVLSGTGVFPNIPNTSPDFVVSELTRTVNEGLSVKTTYEYSNSRYYIGPVGIGRSLGFASITEKDTGTGFYTVSTYFQNDYRLAGLVNTQSLYNAGNNLISQASYTAFGFPNPFGTEMVVPTNRIDNRFHNGSIETSTVSTITYDSYGFPTLKTDSIGDHTVQEFTGYTHDTNNWRLGRIVSTKKVVDGDITEATVYNYSGDSIASSVQFPGSGAEEVTSYEYDSFGNPIASTDALGNLTRISYDSTLNLFPIQNTNALGHVSTKAYDTFFGLETEVVDPNGAKKVRKYDAYGRVSRVTYPGESDWNESFEYNNVGIFNYSNISENQFVGKTTRDNTSGTEVLEITYTDHLGNAIQTISSTAVDGIDLIQDQKYDYRKNLLISKTQPYFSNLSPSWTYFYYEDPDLRLTSTNAPDTNGNILTSVSYAGLTINKTIQYPDGKTKSVSETNDELGRTIAKAENGKTIRTSYTGFGKPKTITDVAGRTTSVAYDSAGRETSVTDPNSGTNRYEYDVLGRTLKKTDAKGNSLRYSYDPLGRVTQILPGGGETPVEFTYDDSNADNSKGRVTKIRDQAGSLEYSYNPAGKPILQKRSIDDITLEFSREYDSLGREILLTYPDGTKIHKEYSSNNNLQSIKMDSADGYSSDINVVQYQGPLFVDGLPVFQKVAGNGNITEVKVDPIGLKTIQLVTKKSDNTQLSSLSYSYDGSGNVSEIKDLLNSQRNRTFAYDSWNRLTKASGNFGTIQYAYSDDGNLIQKGGYTLSYTDGNHANAVTRVYSPSTGTLQYNYDDNGNMVYRNGDSLSYDSYGRMNRVNLVDGGKVFYSYDFSGNRIRSFNETTNTTAYYFGDLYEIVNGPGVPSKHTLYIKGFQDEIVTQITRTDSVLISSAAESSTGVIGALDHFLTSSLSKQFCSGLTISCGDYWLNRWVGPFREYFTYAKYIRHGIPTGFTRIAYIILFLSVLSLGYPMFRRGNELLLRLKYMGFPAPALLVSIFGLTILQDCNLILPAQKQETAPWYVLANGSTSEDVAPVQPPKGSDATNAAGSPVVGAYFYQTDIQGSTLMLTDGDGNQVTGPGQSGVSYISYLPYGETDYTVSTGPDIFRYKYTGQILDSETNLYYYKSRYYDSFLGRFAQADDRFDEGINGLNLYMYVGGNPMNRTDPDGHLSLKDLIHMFNRITGHAMGKDFGPHGVANLNIGKSIQRATFVSHDRWRRFENREFGNWLERSFFISHDRWRKLENRELGRIVGSEKIRNWVKDNISTAKVAGILGEIFLCDSMMGALHTGFCEFTLKLSKSRENCVNVRDGAQKIKEQTVDARFWWFLGKYLDPPKSAPPTGPGDPPPVFEPPAFAQAALFYIFVFEAQVMLFSTMRCPGDTGPLL
ncbi:RHS repeat-associated core domain protein [Leptospira wolffii serovar Khorat str. Khorat-H2]|nr:RHS repeat-associated core domain protein [Leptospira wolffii serovar Khorat str. Khorat-H2]